MDEEEEEDSRPRARTVFEVVADRHREQQETEPVPPPLEPAHLPLIANPRWQLTKYAVTRELDRFAALTGILVTHFMTSILMMPVLMLAIKTIVSVLLLIIGSSVHFTWLQAITLTGGFWIAGPLSFFFYRYWSGHK